MSDTTALYRKRVRTNRLALMLSTFAMLIGRLELLTVLVLFTPIFWRK